MPTLYVRNPYRQMTRRSVDAINEGNIEDPKIIFPVDIRVADDEYLLEAFLPGVSADHLDVQIENNVITLKGEINIEHGEDDRYLVQERPSGMFHRSFELPDDVNADKVEAELKNGVLSLRLPKSELAKPRKIKISNN